MSVQIGSATAYLDLDIERFLTSFKLAIEAAGAASGEMENKVTSKFKTVGLKMQSVGYDIDRFVSKPIRDASRAMIETASDFSQAIANVKAISEASGAQFDKLRAKALELGQTTRFGATEVADAMTEMAKAGWDSQQILDGMAGVLNASAASGENLSSVAIIVADAITSFGLAASDSTRVADLLVQSANSGTIDIADLGDSFKYIAPYARSMGYEIEDVTTAITAMSMSGIKGSMAGTSLRAMIQGFVKPSKEAAATIERLGLDITNTDGTFKPLTETVEMLRGKFANMTEEQKIFTAAQIAGQRGASGMLALLNLSSEAYADIAESMENAGGIAEATAAIMRDNLKGETEKLQNSIEVLSIKFMDVFAPALRAIIEWITKLVNWFADLDDGWKTIIGTVGVFLAALGPVLIYGGKLVSSFDAISGAVTKLAPHFKTLASALLTPPIGVVVAITAAIVAISSFIGWLGKTTKQVTAVIDATNDSRHEFSKQTLEIKENATAAQGLADKLVALSEQEEKSASDKRMMQGLVAELNETIPGLALNIDKETYALDKSSDAIRNYIVQQEARESMSAYQERYVELAQEERLLNDELAEAQKRVAEATGIFGIEKRKAQNDVDALNEALRVNTLEMDNLDVKYKEASETAHEAEQLIFQEIIASAEESGVALDTWADGIEESIDGFLSKLEESEKAWEEYHAALERGAEENMKAMGGIMDSGIDNLKITADEVKANLEQQIADFSEWRAQLKEIHGKVPQDVYDQLVQLGPQGRELLKEYNEMSEDELKEHIAIWEEKMGLARDTAIEELGPLKEGVAEIMWNIHGELEDGAAIFEKDGKQFMVNMAAGMEGEVGDLIGGATLIARNVRGVMQTAADGSADSGSNVVSGLETGMRGRAGGLLSYASGLANSITSRLRGALQISSPSKITTYFGQMLDEGLKGGMKKGEKDVLKQSQSVADVALKPFDKMKDALTDIDIGYSDVNGNLGTFNTDGTLSFGRDIVDYDRLAESVVYALSKNPIVAETYLDGEKVSSRVDRRFARGEEMEGAYAAQF